MKKDGQLICHIYIGDTKVEIRGGDELEYAYIGDENITEMIHSLNAWNKVVERALDERPWEHAA